MENSDNMLIGAVGADREERDALARNLEAMGIASGDLRVFSGRAVEAEIDVESDEAQLLLPLEKELVTSLDAVFLYRAEKNIAGVLRGWAKEGNFWLLDLQGEDVSSYVDPEWSAGALVKAGPVLAVPEADAYWCARLIEGLGEFSPHSPLCHLFLPASDRGSAGVKELFQQSVNALSGKSKQGETMAFGIMPTPPEQSRSQAFESSFRAMAGEGASPERIVLQAPVFHMAAISLVVSVSHPAKACKAAENVLKSAGFMISKGKKWPVAGAASAQAGLVARVNPLGQAVWVWMVYDNARDGKNMLGVKTLSKLTSRPLKNPCGPRARGLGARC